MSRFKDYADAGFHAYLSELNYLVGVLNSRGAGPIKAHESCTVSGCSNVLDDLLQDKWYDILMVDHV